MSGGGGGGGAPATEASSLDFHQINLAVRTVRAQSPEAKVLVILHENHTVPRKLSAEERELIGRWRSEGVLYTTPQGMNDDWYWLHTAMVCGEGCRVVSNDEMRDHHFGLLHTRAFLHWKERQVLHFEIGMAESSSGSGAGGGAGADAGEASRGGDGSGDGSGVPPGVPPGERIGSYGRHGQQTMRLLDPMPYSHCMQQGEGGVWHVPVQGEAPDSWLCLHQSEDAVSSV